MDNFWAFVKEHPGWTFLILLIILGTIESCVAMLTNSR